MSHIRIGLGEAINARSAASAAVAIAAKLGEKVHLEGLYTVTCWAPPAHLEREFVELRQVHARHEARAAELMASWLSARRAGMLPPVTFGRVQLALADGERLQADLDRIPLHEKWSDRFHNTVVTEGKNAILTHFLKGSTYTASQVLGLIESTGYSAISATNTAANITAAGGGSPTNGWNEATSSQCAARQTPSFGTASAGSLAASATSHAILASLTSKGAFLLARSTAGTAPSTTVGNTNGALYSAGLYSGGDKVLSASDTLTPTYTASA